VGGRIIPTLARHHSDVWLWRGDIVQPEGSLMAHMKTGLKERRQQGRSLLNGEAVSGALNGHG
jgi:hypothetical protein